MDCKKKWNQAGALVLPGNMCKMKSDQSSNKIAIAGRAGFENVSAWADLMDRINVFPVADGDTGTNLRVSLAPLRGCENDSPAPSRLLSSGHGNSGNIACAFLAVFLCCDGTDLVLPAKNGRDAAYSAISDPRPGTMLSVFDSLCYVLDTEQRDGIDYPLIRCRLAETVIAGISHLPELVSAGVVDSGALGMFIFFDAFFRSLTGYAQPVASLDKLFGGNLEVAAEYSPQKSREHCVEAVLRTAIVAPDIQKCIDDLGSSAVVVQGADSLRVHLHTAEPEALRRSLESQGDVLRWSDESMDSMEHITLEKHFSNNRIRIVTDAAGSIPLALARKYGILLLDSYILMDGEAIPETLLASDKLYTAMKEGRRVSTAQASNQERHLRYLAVCQQYGAVLYICAGSAFTGNFARAREWLRKGESGGKMELLDSGAASGRLGGIALLSARFAATGATADEVICYAGKLCGRVEEYVFIHELKYLVAGGRVSRGKGFFADLLHMKPVISPHAEGVRKIAVLRSREAQLDFALERLAKLKMHAKGLLILLQYTDNQQWLETVVEPQLRSILPDAELLLLPISLTSGVHMGPGTWSVAFGSNEEMPC